MRRALERDHDLLGDDEPPNDLVLGAPALLGIFFTVALVCAVCFGFGYSSGHGLHLTAHQTTTAESAPAFKSTAPAPPTESANEGSRSGATATESEAPEEQTPAAKPAPGVGYAPSASAYLAETPTHSGATTSALNGQPEAAIPVPQRAPATPAEQAAVVPMRAAEPAAAPAVSLMVQIAAVSHAADAQTLATALRHDGFASVVRTTTGDPFFHVQVGPFTSLQAAKAMRTRLADSGYNAFIKP